jgi:type I restriction enzyme S subunit
MEVSFVGMSGVSEVTASVLDHDVRTAAECRKGYTAFQRGDVLVAKITPCFENGKIVMADIPHAFGFGSTEFHVIRPRPDKLDPRFLLHSLRVPCFRVQGERRMTGSAGQRRVPANFLSTFDIPLPPLPLQRRIAEVLDKAEALRAKRRAALAQLDSLTQSLFLDLFGDPATNPKGWPVRRLGELIVDGPQNGLYKPSTDYGSGTPILRIDAFYDGAVTDISALKRVRLSEAERSGFRLTENDVVINRVNSLEYLGKCALIPKLPEETVFESNMMRMRFDSKTTHPRFVVQFLQSGFAKSQIQMRAKHAVNQASINQQDVSGFRTSVPPIQLQHEFASRVAAVEKLKTAQRAALTELDALFASLQHRAFRGEL